MKRSVLLVSALVLIIAVWGGLQIKNQQWHQWLATAKRDDLEKYIRDNPNQPEALARLGVIVREAGDRAEAEKLLRHSVEIAPTEERNWVELSSAITDDQTAIKDLSDYLKVNPDSVTVLSELSRRWLLVGDGNRAMEMADKAIKISPESAEAWRSKGNILAAQRRLAEAETALRKSLSLKDQGETRLDLVRMLIPVQRYSEVIDLCAPLLKKTDIPADQHARALLYTAGGKLYYPLTPDELKTLQTQLKEAENLSGKMSPEEGFLPPYFLGESFLRGDEPKEAIPCFERSIALGPMFAGSLYSLARAYRLAGETAKADATSERHRRLSRLLSEMEMYNNRLEQRPEDAETILHLAGTMAELGNTSAATQLYRRLVSLGKYLDIAQKKLQTLPSSP